uniref:Uncharacterized protein n=1 Tax=Kalanchoe fedtschenkoi TaxID=63787 RepID=A0A7N0TC42_KALFE
MREEYIGKKNSQNSNDNVMDIYKKFSYIKSNKSKIVHQHVVTVMSHGSAPSLTRFLRNRRPRHLDSRAIFPNPERTYSSNLPRANFSRRPGSEPVINSKLTNTSSSLTVQKQLLSFKVRMVTPCGESRLLVIRRSPKQEKEKQLADEGLPGSNGEDGCWRCGYLNVTAAVEGDGDDDDGGYDYAPAA